MTDSLSRLLDIMAQLRNPEGGCPWDLEQTFASIIPYTIEEAYEVADAIERGDYDDLRDELGDLLLQVVFHARMAEELELFRFEDVATAISEKLIRRHPHVFRNADARTPEEVAVHWARIKAEEKAARATRRAAAGMPEPPAAGALGGVPLALPALVRAVKLQEKAGAVGFDWANARLVLDKIREEIDEVAAELPEAAPGAPAPAALADEIGDLLFAVANLARHAGVDAERALHGASAKFERRFSHIERRLAEDGRTPAQSSLDEMEALWGEAKSVETSGRPTSAGAQG
jgi:nucleoside triphosphate diphosphatase